MFTSGTESRPKGALLTSRSLLWQYVSCAIDGSHERRRRRRCTRCRSTTARSSTASSAPTSTSARPASSCPARTRPRSCARSRRSGSPSSSRRRRCGSRCCAAPGFDDADLSSLRKGYYGASPMPVEVLKEIQRRGCPDVDLWNFYGQTEMAPLATILGPDEQLTHAGLGRPRGAQRRDPDRRRPRPAGAGRHGRRDRAPLAARDARLLPRRRRRRPRRSAAAGSTPATSGTSTTSGHLYVVDRKKDMIKTGGENVASREVEEAIYRLDGVAEVAVFGISHPTLGRGGRRGRRPQGGRRR